jgi:CRP/FNR family transcriptional regulator
MLHTGIDQGITTEESPTMLPTHDPIDISQGRRLRAVRCTASDLLRCTGLSHLAGAETDEIAVAMRDAPADSALYHEGQAFDHLYCVASGSFKAVQCDAEGYEQVLGFGIRGDLLGLDSLGSGRHPSGVVALEDSTVMVLPAREFVAGAHRVAALEVLLHRAIGAELYGRGQTQYLMSAPSSEVRVARFLLTFARRLHALDRSDRQMRLCMSRRDIASHLGIAHETVSRALSALDHGGSVRVSNRWIEIVDADALEELQRITRGAPRGRAPRERVADVA